MEDEKKLQVVKRISHGLARRCSDVVANQPCKFVGVLKKQRN